MRLIDDDALIVGLLLSSFISSFLDVSVFVAAAGCGKIASSFSGRNLRAILQVPVGPCCGRIRSNAPFEDVIEERQSHRGSLHSISDVEVHCLMIQSEGRKGLRGGRVGKSRRLCS
eukprot:1499090-Amphidinium_carterae.1